MGLMAQPTQVGGLQISVFEKYKATVSEAVKITSQPDVKDTTVDKLPVLISVRPRFAEPVVRFELISPLTIGKTKVERMPSNYLTVGVGNYTSPEMAFAFGNGRSTGTTWSVQAQHFSTQSGVKDRLYLDNATMNNEFRTRLVQSIGNTRLGLEAGASLDQFSFYGVPLDSAVNLADTAKRAPGRWVQTYTLGMNWQPTRFTRKSVFYGLSSDYHYFDDMNGRQQEHRLSGTADFRKKIEKVILVMPIQVTALQLNQRSAVTSVDSLGRTELLGVEFAPSVADSVGRLHFTAGFRVVPVWTRVDTTVTTKAYFFPEIKGELPLVTNALNVFGGWIGRVHMEGMRNVVAQNPYVLESSPFKPTSENRIYVGFNGRITGRLGYMVTGQILNYTNKAMFYRAPGQAVTDSGRFVMEYTDLSIVQPKAELSYQHPAGVEIRTYGLLNRTSRLDENNNKLPFYHLPEWEVGAHVLVNLKGKIRVESDVRYVGAREIPSVSPLISPTLDPFVDVRLGVYYAYNKQLSAYINATNLLNDAYSLWQGYDTQGTRVMLGLSYSF